MHFSESKSQGTVTLKKEHLIVQAHCFGVIEQRILKLAVESGFPKETRGTAVLNCDFILPASKRISEKYFFLGILLELFITKKIATIIKWKEISLNFEKTIKAATKNHCYEFF